MNKRLFTLVAILIFSSAAASQSTIDQQQPQLTPVPPRPTCTLIFKTGSCADLWNAYNQAVGERQREELQIYVNRQKDLASAQATAPLQEQISDLQKLNSDQQAHLGKLQQQMQADAAAALDAKAESHLQGMEEVAATGAGAVLILFGLVFLIRRLSQSFTVTRKAEA